MSNPLWSDERIIERHRALNQMEPHKHNAGSGAAELILEMREEYELEIKRLKARLEEVRRGQRSTSAVTPLSKRLRWLITQRHLSCTESSLT